jgi:ribosomal protein L12E/L44/L45/RPP1/RPP2
MSIYSQSAGQLDVDSVTTMSSEAAVSYASLILADAEIEITSDKLLALTKAAGIEVEPVSFT